MRVSLLPIPRNPFLNSQWQMQLGIANTDNDTRAHDHYAGTPSGASCRSDLGAGHTLILIRDAIDN